MNKDSARKRMYEEVKWSLRRIKDQEIDRIILTQDDPDLIIKLTQKTIDDYDKHMRIMAERIFEIA